MSSSSSSDSDSSEKSEERDLSRLLVIEPLYGGGHKKMIDSLLKICRKVERKVYRSTLAGVAQRRPKWINGVQLNYKYAIEVGPKKRYTLITMPPTKWEWRSRCSAMYLAEIIPRDHSYEILFCSSVLPLAELIGIRPDLAHLFKIVYFHENHLELTLYPYEDLNYHLGHSEIMTCLAADQVLFNSNYHAESFIAAISKHMAKQPDFTVSNLEKKIRNKSQVVHFPLDLHTIELCTGSAKKRRKPTLCIIWPHRWELDRNPLMFFRIIKRMDDEGYDFRVIMLPSSYMVDPQYPLQLQLMDDIPKSRLLVLDDIESSDRAYYASLKCGDVILSTAKHEFFAHQIMEGMYCNLIPVIPRLPVYQELFNDIKDVYDNENQLYEILVDLCDKKRAGILDADPNYKRNTYRFESCRWFQSLMSVLKCKLI
ncbi:glycosyltransferase-like domain-containing protein 1-like [Ostrinia furnacalis]|uniref:glycosyltransferase-like domain-containing protein 1-like n=1 Tax=Ostrinia furnacalis TaxID=93504 RepID=UPI00103E7A46|nr:glycosyltransferase-like domain-containing protein 1-like [Ostrinia furnacalis]